MIQSLQRFTFDVRPTPDLNTRPERTRHATHTRGHRRTTKSQHAHAQIMSPSARAMAGVQGVIGRRDHGGFRRQTQTSAPSRGAATTAAETALHVEKVRDLLKSTDADLDGRDRCSEYACNTVEAVRCKRNARANAAQPAVSCRQRAAAAADTPVLPVESDADELDGHEAAAVVGLDHASLSRQAHGTRCEHAVASGHAAASGRSPGSCLNWSAGVLLIGSELRGRSWTSAPSVAAAVRSAKVRCRPMDGSAKHPRSISCSEPTN